MHIDGQGNTTTDDETFSHMNPKMRIDGQGNTPITDDEIQEEYPSNEAMKNATSQRRRRLLLAIAATVILVVFVAAVSVSVAVVVNKNKTSSSETIDKDSSIGLDTEDEAVSKSPPTNSPTTSLRIGSTTESPTALPSDFPSLTPTTRPSLMPTMTPVTTFYAVGDAPYSAKQEVELTDQIGNIPDDAEFVVHIGDIRADDGLDCQKSEYEAIGQLLQNSRAPVFIVMGDNDWNDCPNMNQGYGFWHQTFNGFESQHWNHTFEISRHPNYNETFTFFHKGTLFIGLNLVGGEVHNTAEWSTRLTEQVEWTKQLIREHMTTTVIFGHANPTDNHEAFFGPLQLFIQDELQNSLPILYLNGDKHQWQHQTSFYSQTSWTRIMLTGGTSEPPLKVMVDSSGGLSDTFTYDRQLS